MGPFPHDAPLGAEFRRVVGTHQGAVLATETLVVQVFHDSRHRVFLVSVDRTAVEASWIDAVVAGTRDRLLSGHVRGAAVQ